MGGIYEGTVRLGGTAPSSWRRRTRRRRGGLRLYYGARKENALTCGPALSAAGGKAHGAIWAGAWLGCCGAARRGWSNGCCLGDGKQRERAQRAVEEGDASQPSRSLSRIPTRTEAKVRSPGPRARRPQRIASAVCTLARSHILLHHVYGFCCRLSTLFFFYHSRFFFSYYLSLPRAACDYF